MKYWADISNTRKKYSFNITPFHGKSGSQFVCYWTIACLFDDNLVSILKHGVIIDVIICSEILTEGESELREYFKCL